MQRTDTQKDFAVQAAGIRMMQTTLVLSISETGQVIEILELCREHQYSHKNLQNAIRIVYEKRHIAYKTKQAASA